MVRIAALLFIGGTITFAQSAALTVQKREPLTLTGDSIINERMSVFKEPEFTKLFDLIRGADAAFTNLEMMASRSKPFGATVTVSNGVGYGRPTPSSSR